MEKTQKYHSYLDLCQSAMQRETESSFVCLAQKSEAEKMLIDNVPVKMYTLIDKTHTHKKSGVNI